MFDDFRQQAADDSAFEEAPQEDAAKSARKALANMTLSLGKSAEEDAPASDLVFGLTGPQRFVLSIMLLMMVTMLGILILLVTGKIYIPL